MRNTQGFSLIEGLIALAIFSMSLLGLAGVIFSSKALSFDMQARSRAMHLAQDLSQRLAVLQVPPSHFTHFSTLVHQACGSICAPSQMLNNELADWYSNLQLQLPGANAIMCYGAGAASLDPLVANCDSGTLNVYTLKIWWQAPNGPTLEAYALTFAS